MQSSDSSRYINSVSDLYGDDEIEFLLDDIRELEPLSCKPEELAACDGMSFHRQQQASTLYNNPHSHQNNQLQRQYKPTTNTLVQNKTSSSTAYASNAILPASTSSTSDAHHPLYSTSSPVHRQLFGGVVAASHNIIITRSGGANYAGTMAGGNHVGIGCTRNPHTQQNVAYRSPLMNKPSDLEIKEIANPATEQSSNVGEGIGGSAGSGDADTHEDTGLLGVGGGGESPFEGTVHSWDSHCHYRVHSVSPDVSVYSGVIVYCDHTHFKTPTGFVRVLLVLTTVACLTCLCTSGTVKVGLFMLPLANRIRFMLFVTVFCVLVTCVLLFLDISHMVYLFPFPWAKLNAYLYLAIGILFLIASSLLFHMTFAAEMFAWVPRWTHHQITVTGSLGYVCCVECIVLTIIQKWSKEIYEPVHEDQSMNLEGRHTSSSGGAHRGSSHQSHQSHGGGISSGGPPHQTSDDLGDYRSVPNTPERHVNAIAMSIRHHPTINYKTAPTGGANYVQLPLREIHAPYNYLDDTMQQVQPCTSKSTGHNQRGSHHSHNHHHHHHNQNV